jgi:superfamily II DNA or RNA helicase
MTVENSTTQRRAFTAAQRQTAFIAANGLCQICGCALGADFHADHIEPYSAGGETSEDNLQALCPSCNLKKGAKTTMDAQRMPTRKGREPRQWQQEAFDAIRKISKTTALIQATPAAGKTGLACGVARFFLDLGRVDRVVVVSPSVALQEDWARDLSAIGIEVDPDSEGKTGEARDFMGRSLTYAVLSKSEGRNSGADVERILQGRSRTLVILDEIHHAADKASWGIGLRHACEHAEFVLCLSGTPFRSDGNPIPFVTYSPEGEAVADYVYSYAQAINASPQVCRQVYFPAYEGDLRWLDQDALYEKSFSDELNEKLESKRLRAALQSDDWMITQLMDANQRLVEIRSSHPQAGGLVVAMDQYHARYLAGLMESVCHSRPTLVISDDKDSDQLLKAFRAGVDPWVIAVRKISEGVDVPRLRVCVYATNVITEMFFRQVVGRVVRFTPGIEHQEAFVYIPSDQRLVKIAERIQEERALSILKEAEETRDDDKAAGVQTMDDLLGRSGFCALDGVGWHENTINYQGETFTHREIEDAKPIASEFGIRPEIVARMIRKGLFAKTNGHGKPDDKPDVPLYEQKRQARSSEASKRLATEIRWKFLGAISDNAEAYRFLNVRLNMAVGATTKNATIDQMKKRAALLEAAAMSHEVPSWLK